MEPRKKFFKKAPSNLIYGVHPILEALRSGKELDKIILKRGMRNEAIKEIFTRAQEMEIPIQEVPMEKLNFLVNGNHQGIAAFTALISYKDVTQIIPWLFEQGKMPFILVLDRITDVRNFGAIARSASCAGVDALLIPSRGGAQVSEDAVKTSAGALHHLPICRSYNLKETLKFLKDSGVKVIGVTEKATTAYYETDLNSPVALMMGSEEDGISPEYLKLCDETVTIPMTGPISSLNVSVAAGVLLFETLKQRATE